METQVDEKFVKRKKIVINSIIATSVLLVIVLFLIIYLSVLESKKTKYCLNNIKYHPWLLYALINLY